MTAMSHEDAGGCAFPRQPNRECMTDGSPGMSLRDWFAGQALRVADNAARDCVKAGAVEPHKAPQLIAEFAYDIADAMLAAREKGTP